VISAIALLLLLPLPRAVATESVTFDEVWWNDASQDEQMYAVEGAIDAYENGFSDGIIHAAVRFGKSDAAMRMLQSDDQTFRQTFGFYVSSITNFYATHPGASRATIGTIVSCLADKPLYTCEQIANFSSSKPQP